MSKEGVRRFWEKSPCGAVHGEAAEGTREYFAQIERRRNELEPFIADYADFRGTRGVRVLEVGVGLGTDFVQFARAGAQVTGVDLTERAVTLVRRRLALEGLDGEVVVADAERLPFDSDRFDVVYSWGVLHHTPDTATAIAEVMRVLRPGGRLCVMLYNRRSWVAMGLWLRHALLGGRPFRSPADVIANHMESDGTKAFTYREVSNMFSGLRDIQIERVGTQYDRHFGGPFAAATGRRLGWFIVVRGRL
jgi:SAM-dependent methyltransferase